MPTELHAAIQSAFSTLLGDVSLQSLVSIMRCYSRHAKPCFLVVDGIDALPETEILSFIKVLRDLWTPPDDTSLRLFLSCRETLGRRIRPESIASSTLLTIKLSHVEADIRRYVDHEVESRQGERSITEDSALLAQIKSVLKTNSAKMFLWIHLQILSIWDPGLTTCDQDIRDQLQTLPEGLDDIYLRCLYRINDTNDKRSREIAPRVFKWVAFVQEPLTPSQACEAASMTPENLPLQQTQLLTCLVTDYCANLVVVDDLTGSIKFPHPTVKEFLCDADKIPDELSYLGLSKTDGELWCGRICLAYAKMHHARKQLVPFRPQQVQRNITLPIVQNLVGVKLPFWKKSPGSSASTTSFRFPVSMVPKKVSAVVDSSLHDYMCKNWLSHNTCIGPDHEHYRHFADLCISHDSDLQPWVTTSNMNLDHYQRMVFYAVATNHQPLLRLAHEYLVNHKKGFWRGVFRSYVPGTGSTYLHYAAVLGHVHIARMLLALIPPSTQDDSGMSAAAVAIRAQQNEVVRALVEYTLPTTAQLLQARPAWGTIQLAEENLLSVCFESGNYDAAIMLLNILWESHRNYEVVRSGALRSVTYSDLKKAFFIACRDGRYAFARLLIPYNVGPNYFRSSDVGSQFDLSDNYPVLHAALKLENLEMMKTLLELDKEFPQIDHDCDLLHVFVHFRGSWRSSEPFIRLFLQYGRTINRSTRERRDSSELWWLKILISKEYVTSNMAAMERDQFIRIILDTSYDGSNNLAVLRGHHELPVRLAGIDFDTWLERIADDILVRITRFDWISRYYLETDACLQAAMKRSTSRFLEAMSESRARYHANLEHDDNNVTPMASLGSMRPLIGSFLIQIEGWQIMEFLACCDASILTDIYASLEILDRRKIRKLHDALDLYNRQGYKDEFPCLMWIRCFQKVKGDIDAAVNLCRTLQYMGADGNFALNFPWGYYLIKRRKIVPFHTSGGLGLYQSYGVSQKIRLPLLRWNFRLNRARQRSFSESDWWYAAELVTAFLNQSRTRPDFGIPALRLKRRIAA